MTEHHCWGTLAKNAVHQANREQTSEESKRKSIRWNIGVAKKFVRVLYKLLRKNSNQLFGQPNTWPTFFKNAEVLRYKERLGNCPQLEETKDPWQLHATRDPGLDLGKIKDISGKGRWNPNKVCSFISTLPILTPWFCWIYCHYVRS